MKPPEARPPSAGLLKPTSSASRSTRRPRRSQLGEGDWPSRIPLLASFPLVVVVARRLASVVLLVLAITSVAFALTNLVPSDPVAANLGEVAASNPRTVAAYRARYGLDKPITEQYGLFLVRLAHGDLGVSEQSRRPVTKDLLEYIPASAELAVFSTVLAMLLGVALGLLAAIRRDGTIDQILRILSLSGTSLPIFWLAILTVYVFFFKLGWFPGGGRLDPSFDIPPHVTGSYLVDSLISGQIGSFMNSLDHLILPAAVLATPTIGLLIRFTRATVLDVLQEDFILAARAKGLSEISVLRHLLRAALPPIVTVVGFQFADVLSGTVLVETIFNWPGLGRYAFNAAISLDLPAIMGATLVVAIVFALINLVVDLAYGLIDPRLRIS